MKFKGKAVLYKNCFIVYVLFFFGINTYGYYAHKYGIILGPEDYSISKYLSIRILGIFFVIVTVVAFWKDSMIIAIVFIPLEYVLTFFVGALHLYCVAVGNYNNDNDV